MKDLENPLWMWLKAAGFIVIGGCCFALIWMDSPHLRTAVLLALMVWAFCRLYYFAFYVIGKYIDPSFKFSGLISFIRYVLTKRN